MASKPIGMDGRGDLRATGEIPLAAMLIVVAFGLTRAGVDGRFR